MHQALHSSFTYIVSFHISRSLHELLLSFWLQMKKMVPAEVVYPARTQTCEGLPNMAEGPFIPVTSTSYWLCFVSCVFICFLFFELCDICEPSGNFNWKRKAAFVQGVQNEAKGAALPSPFPVWMTAWTRAAGSTHKYHQSWAGFRYLNRAAAGWPGFRSVGLHKGLPGSLGKS